jgi:hypothetical protein
LAIIPSLDQVLCDPRKIQSFRPWHYSSILP